MSRVDAVLSHELANLPRLGSANARIDAQAPRLCQSGAGVARVRARTRTRRTRPPARASQPARRPAKEEEGTSRATAPHAPSAT
eukprot:6945627-Pyramimonas_sp.AAC.1